VTSRNAVPKKPQETILNSPLEWNGGIDCCHPVRDE
jgi:hypothetical protein